MTWHDVALECFRNAELVAGAGVGAYVATLRRNSKASTALLNTVRAAVNSALSPIHARLTRLEQLLQIPPFVSEAHPT